MDINELKNNVNYIDKDIFDNINSFYKNIKIDKLEDCVVLEMPFKILNLDILSNIKITYDKNVFKLSDNGCFIKYFTEELKLQDETINLIFDKALTYLPFGIKESEVYTMCEKENFNNSLSHLVKVMNIIGYSYKLVNEV